MREAGGRGFRYPGLLSVVLGHLALLHELVGRSSFQRLKGVGWEGGGRVKQTEGGWRGIKQSDWFRKCVTPRGSEPEASAGRNAVKDLTHTQTRLEEAQRAEVFCACSTNSG